MQPLLKSVDSFGPPIYYTKRFRQMVEDHLTIIRSMPTVRTRNITETDWGDLNRFEGDFNRFLRELNFLPQYHWVIMRMNGFRSRFDIRLGLESLLIPDFEYIDKLAQLSKEKRKN